MATATSDWNGNASANLQLNPLSAAVQVTVCVAPINNPCQIFNATAVQGSSLQLQAVAGMLQIAPPGQGFQPVIVRVVDSANPPHAVLGAGAVFLSYVGHTPHDRPIVWVGEAGISQPGIPVILAKSQSTVQSDIDGLASISLSTAGISGNVAVAGTATVGASGVQFAAQQLGP